MNTKCLYPVVITVTSDNLMGSRQAQSDANGSYFIAELPPGTYRFEAKRDKFKTVVRPNVTVKIGANAIVNITMPLEGASEEIIVEETRAVIDTGVW